MCQSDTVLERIGDIQLDERRVMESTKAAELRRTLLKNDGNMRRARRKEKRQCWRASRNIEHKLKKRLSSAACGARRLQADGTSYQKKL